MSKVPYIALLGLVACGSAGDHAVHHALQAGNSDYRAGRFVDAASAYNAAPEDHRTMFNQGDANYRAGQWTPGIEHFTKAIELGPDPSSKARSYFNLGNAEAQRAHWADSLVGRAGEVLSGITIDGDDIARKVELIVLRDSLRNEQHRLKLLSDSSLNGAIEAFKNTLRHMPGDEEARYNLMAVKHALDLRRDADARNKGGDDDKDKEKELSARAKLLVQHADSLVEKYMFREALNVLQDGLKKEPSLKKQEQFMQKLEVVTKAATAS